MENEYFPGFLNDDCWRHVLDYVSVRDIVSMGQVCRWGAAVVQRYLEGVRFRIETITNVWDVDEEQRRRKCRILILRDEPLCLSAVLCRWGHLVAELIYDARLANEHVLRNLGTECPNIQDITFVRLKWDSQSCDWAKKFTTLKRVCFENCKIKDSCVSELIKNNKLEELVFRMTESLTGSFLVTGVGSDDAGDLTNLNTLILSRCPNLDFEHLQSAVEPVNYLTGVKKLELRDVPPDIHEKAHLLLEKMPQLEHLTFDCSVRFLKREVVVAAGRLLRLRHLGWVNGQVLRGEELQAARDDASRLMAPPGEYADDVWCERLRRILSYRRRQAAAPAPAPARSPDQEPPLPPVHWLPLFDPA